MARTNAHCMFSPRAYARGGAVRQAKQEKIEQVMDEYGRGELHRGSKSGPVVRNQRQAVAIALNSARKGK